MIPAVRRGSRILTVAAFLAMPSVPHAHAQELQRGVIIDEVNCANDQAQTYALYLPSTYSAERTWPLLIAFHPAARGRAMVEKYQAAAEQYRVDHRRIEHVAERSLGGVDGRGAGDVARSRPPRVD